MLKGSLPLYIQVKNRIQENVIGRLKPNDLIPSEHTLMEEYDVSRTTIRKALDQLIQEGIVYKKHGIGTFVAEEKTRQQLANYAGFSRQMEKMDYVIQYTVLNQEIIPCNNELAKKLGISLNEKVFYLKRKATRNGEYINFTQSYIPYKYVEGIENYNFGENSLYYVLEDHYHIAITKITKGIEAILADYDTAQILHIKEGVPILTFDGFVTADQKENRQFLMEYFKTYYRTDDTKFFITQNVE